MKTRRRTGKEGDSGLTSPTGSTTSTATGGGGRRSSRSKQKQANEGDDSDVAARVEADISLQVQQDRPLVEFLQLLDQPDMQPIIPDAVTDYYLSRSGFDCPDIRIKRLMALAAQKFVTDIAQDAYQYCKIRQQGLTARDKRMAGRDRKTVLTMEDLSAALAEYGINLKRPEYYT